MSDWLLSKPSKMPGYSFSLPALITCPVAKAMLKQHGDATTCASCYATRNFYTWPGTKRAQQRRLDFLLQSLRENDGDEFVATMTALIARRTRATKYFRIHDAGDFFNPAYVRVWVRIARALPDVRFWAPTREYVRAATLEALQELASLPNVTVRPSAILRNAPAPDVDGLATGSAVYDDVRDVPKGHRVCPATREGREKSCEANGCTACWDSALPVVYLTH